MTTLNELIATTRWTEIKAALAWLYPDERPRLDDYRRVFRELRSLTPEAGSMRIAIKRAPLPEPDDKTALEVIGRDGTCNRDLEEFTHWDERARAELGAMETSWSLSFRPWREWLGMAVEPATLEAYSPAHVMAHCLYDMTFHGFCEAAVQDVHEELLHRVAEVEAMSEEEKAEKLIPFEQVMAEFGKGMDD